MSADNYLFYNFGVKYLKNFMENQMRKRKR